MKTKETKRKEALYRLLRAQFVDAARSYNLYKSEMEKYNTLTEAEKDKWFDVDKTVYNPDTLEDMRRNLAEARASWERVVPEETRRIMMLGWKMYN
jgi:hypothetical protein